MNRLLTILIPNYNRATELAGLLNSVFDSIDAADAADLVDVIVVDDFSSEPMDSVKSSFGGRPNFKFLLQSKKCGNAETAFLNAIEHVHADYTWLVGNDDLLLIEAVSHVIAITKEFSPGLIILNPEIAKAKAGRSFTPLYADVDLVAYPQTRDLFLDFGFATSTTTFSCIVVRTKEMRAFQEAFDFSQVATVYSHTFAIFCAMRELKGLYIGMPLVRFTLNEANDEQAKLQKQAPLNIPLFHQSLGLARLTNAAARIANIPVKDLLTAKEDEVNKDSMEVVSGTTRHFISYFLLEQFCWELHAAIARDRTIGHLCYSEVLEIFEIIKKSEDEKLISLLQEAIGVYGSPLMPKEWKHRYLRSRQRDLREMAESAAFAAPTTGCVNCALKIFGPNLKAVPLRGTRSGFSSQAPSPHTSH